MAKHDHVPEIETRVRLAAGMAIPFVFFAILLWLLVGAKAGLALFGVVAVVLVAYVVLPALFHRKPKAETAKQASEGHSHH